MSQVVILGEALIDIFAQPGVPLRDAEQLFPAPGGAPANVAVALARLGVEVSFIGRVGKDDYGQYLIDILKNAGVTTTHFVADQRAPTMIAIVAVPGPDEQHFILHTGASDLLSSDDLPEEVITGGQIFVFGSVTLATRSGEAALQAAKWARSAGRQVFFDVNLRPLVWPELNAARTQIALALQHTTIVKMNEFELEFVSGTPDLESGTSILLQNDIQLCLVTLGERGAYFNNGNATGLVGGFPVQVKDTTGSGDAFVAGLTYQICQQSCQPAQLTAHELREMVTFANACGALAATQVGGMTASPDRESIAQLLQQL